LTEHISRELNREGFITEIRNVHKGVYRCYLKFRDLLQQYELTGHPNEKILIQLDIDENLGGPNTTRLSKQTTKIINKFGIFKEIITYTPEVLLAKKIQTLVGRKRPKGRDVYDVVYLSSITAPDYELLSKALGVDGDEKLKALLLDFCDKNDLEALAKDIQPFLIDPKQVEMVIRFREWVEEKSLHTKAPTY